MVRAGHKTRTQLEAAICAEMERQQLPHEHRTLHYRVRMKSGKVAKYEPAIIAHRGPILFLVEPFASAAAGAVERSLRFLDQHSPEIVYTVVAPKAVAAKLPLESYDELYDADRIRECVLRIKGQDPLGPVRPFLKRRVTGSS
ncbi:MAG TPA: hypothetical protein VGR51_09570 [Thermoplasmata archaeon]|nr:hypothetical protein [Thermoplasmata archaeon]